MKKPLSLPDEAYLEQPAAAETLPPDPPEVLDIAAGELVREARASTEVMTQDDLAESLVVNQMIGITTYARTLDSLNKVTQLKALQRIKESKAYKTMVLPDPDGGIIRPKTWDGLCKALNLSRSKVDEDLENLAIFGGKLIEEQKALGIGYRELRALRAGLADLPDARKEEVKDLIAAAAASGDKEEILATLEELGARNAKLTGELQDAKKTIRAKDTLQAKTTEKANTLEIRLGQALNPGSEDERQMNLHAARKALRSVLDEECNSLVGLASTLCTRIANARKADTVGTAMGDPVIDAELWDHINTRVALAFDSMRSLALTAGLDVEPVEYGDVPADEHEQGHTQQ